MPSSPDKNLALEIAHVLFIDVVGYSKLLIDEQARCLKDLQEIVRDTAEFRCASPREQLISLPTGDGMALAFFGDALAPVRCALEIGSALKSTLGIELRMGVHSGPISRVVDINEKVNVAGEGINFAQRVMDVGGSGHILVSKKVADIMRQVSGWAEYLYDLGEVEVKHGILIHVFNLYTGECGNPDPPQKKGSRLAAPLAIPAPPSLGPFVSKLCNRNPQVRDFTEFFNANLRRDAGRPLFCFVHGGEKECHDSLVERLVHVHVKPIAARVWGDLRGRAVFRKVRWPHQGQLSERQQELQQNLFAEFDPAYIADDTSAAALSRLTASLLSPLVVIQHNLYGEQWDKHACALISWYMDYWGEIKAGNTGPLFLLFLNVLYPQRHSSGRWRLWLSPRQADRKQIHADLQHLCASQEDSCPRLLLQELVAPQQHEVGDWFSQHNIHDVKTRDELLRRMFAGPEPVTMADIEHELEIIHYDFARKRGA